MFNDILSGEIERAIFESVEFDKIAEVRLRAGRQLLIVTVHGKRIIPRAGRGGVIVSKQDIDDIFARATDGSPYAVSDEIIKGFVPAKGVRIGVGGVGVLSNGEVISVKDIAYLVIRVPHSVRTAADEVIGLVFDKDMVKNTLVISPPGGGKTTMLRELARLISKAKNVVVIDERFEIAEVCQGVPTLDIGDAEVVSGIPKKVAYENCVRALSPEVIITDELFKEGDVDAICDVVRSGVSVIASLHGESTKVLDFSAYSKLKSVFELVLELSKNPIGKVTAVELV